jgi:hypothetical protein
MIWFNSVASRMTRKINVLALLPLTGICLAAGCHRSDAPATNAPAVTQDNTIITNSVTNSVTTTTGTTNTGAASGPPPTPRPVPTSTIVPLKKLPTPTPAPIVAVAIKSNDKSPLVVDAQVIATSKVPAPANSKDKDSLMYIKYKVLKVSSGTYAKPELLVVHWAMKGKKLAPAAAYKVGQKVHLQVEPFTNHPELEALAQNDEIGELELPTYYSAS